MENEITESYNDVHVQMRRVEKLKEQSKALTERTQSVKNELKITKQRLKMIQASAEEMREEAKALRHSLEVEQFLESVIKQLREHGDSMNIELIRWPESGTKHSRV